MNTSNDSDGYHDRGSKRKRNKYRVNSTKWNIEKERLIQLRKVELLPIPQQSIEILSRLVINYQLLEIVKLLQIRKNYVLFHAKMNLKTARFSDLKSDDVTVKIFTRRNHTKLDIEVAEGFSMFVFLQGRESYGALVIDRWGLASW